MSAKENLKEIKTLAKEFYKTASERQVYTQEDAKVCERYGKYFE